MLKTIVGLSFFVLLAALFVTQANAAGIYTLSGIVRYPSGVHPTTVLEATTGKHTRYLTTVRPDGTYTFYSLGSGAYTVTPGRVHGWMFLPKSQKVQVTSSVSGVNFTAAKR